MRWTSCMLCARKIMNIKDFGKLVKGGDLYKKTQQLYKNETFGFDAMVRVLGVDHPCFDFDNEPEYADMLRRVAIGAPEVD